MRVCGVLLLDPSDGAGRRHGASDDGGAEQLQEEHAVDLADEQRADLWVALLDGDVDLERVAVGELCLFVLRDGVVRVRRGSVGGHREEGPDKGAPR